MTSFLASSHASSESRSKAVDRPSPSSHSRRPDPGQPGVRFHRLHRFRRWSTLATGALAVALAATDLASAGPRLDQIQVVGTHNSYHIAPHPALDALIRARDPLQADALAYTHRPLEDQLERLGIRQVELDLYADPLGGRYAEPAGIRLAAEANPEAPAIPAPPVERLRQPGTKILHVPDFDFQTTCHTLQEALQDLLRWSTNHPAHVPLFVLLELKSDAAIPGYAQPLPWSVELLDALEVEILSIVPRERILRPDDLRGPRRTLREAIDGVGWPPLAETRGRFVFLLDNTDAVRERYLARSPVLAERLLFASVDESHPAAAWFKVNEAMTDFDRIQRLVRRGFLVRTRADADTIEARRQDPRRREAALASGAQLISTDYPEPQPSWGTYVGRWPGTAVARPNPVSSARPSATDDLEVLAVRGWEPFVPAELALLNRSAMALHDRRRLNEASEGYARLLELEPPVRPPRDLVDRILGLAPELMAVAGEPFPLRDVVALHHPSQPLIAYHLFWEDDIDFPDDNDPADHEVVWVRYEPISGRAETQLSYFHGRILRAPADAGRPRFAVEWGKHGSLPFPRNANPVEAPGLMEHWRRLHETGIRRPRHPLAAAWPKRFTGNATDYRRFDLSIDTRSWLERRGSIWISPWANAVLDQHALPYNFAAKREWPE